MRILCCVKRVPAPGAKINVPSVAVSVHRRAPPRAVIATTDTGPLLVIRTRYESVNVDAGKVC